MVEAILTISNKIIIYSWIIFLKICFELSLLSAQASSIMPASIARILLIAFPLKEIAIIGHSMLLVK